MEEQLSEVTRRSEVSSKAGTCGLLWCSTLEVPESESLTEHFSFILSSLHSSQSLYLRKKGTWKLSKKSLSKTLTSLRRGQLFKSPFVFCYLKQGTLVTEWAEKHVSMTEQYLYEMKILQERKFKEVYGTLKVLSVCNTQLTPVHGVGAWEALPGLTQHQWEQQPNDKLLPMYQYVRSIGKNKHLYFEVHTHTCTPMLHMNLFFLIYLLACWDN